MCTIPLTVLSPGGNTTILAPMRGMSAAKQAQTAAAVLADNPWDAEQMGFYSTTPPALRMAGGEFCCNATRALAVLLAQQGVLPACAAHNDGTPLKKTSADALHPPLHPPLHHATAGTPSTAFAPQHWHGSIATSGLTQDVHVRVSLRDGVYTAAVSLCCPPPPCTTLTTGISLVRMPGINHIIIDSNEMPFHKTDWRRQAAALLARFALQDAPATGCIWYSARGEDWRIDPVVTVREPLTVFYESACGSGSMALACFLRECAQGQKNCPLIQVSYKIFQPSGSPLEVTISSAPVVTNAASGSAGGTSAEGMSASVTGHPPTPSLCLTVDGVVTLLGQGEFAAGKTSKM